MDERVSILINYVNVKANTKGRKPIWYHKLFKHVNNINDHSSLKKYLDNNPNFFEEVMKSNLKLEKMKKDKFSKLWNFRNLIEKNQCDKLLFRDLIEYPEIYSSHDILQIILKTLNDLTVTSHEYDQIKKYLQDLNI